jgi:hypothetical protein
VTLRALWDGRSFVSVWQLAAVDIVSFSVRDSSDILDITSLSGKSILLPSQEMQRICIQELLQVGVDPLSVQYIAAGPDWGIKLAEGFGDAAIVWEGLRAEWKNMGLPFRYLAGKDFSDFPGMSFVIRQSDLDISELVDLYTRYLKGWAQGMEFGYVEPRAAAQITLENAPNLHASKAPNPQIAVDYLWQVALAYRGDWENRQAWGWHDLSSWQRFSEIFEVTINWPSGWPPVEERTTSKVSESPAMLQSRTTAVSWSMPSHAQDDLVNQRSVTNELVASANEFDHERVRQDAKQFGLAPDFASLPQIQG